VVGVYCLHSIEALIFRFSATAPQLQYSATPDS
jgi:hypothetical protein